jgi:hypothetical protein
VFDSVLGDVCVGCFQFLSINYLGVINKGGWKSLGEFVCKIKQKEKRKKKTRIQCSLMGVRGKTGT